MKAYSVFVIANKKDQSKIKLSDFSFEKCIEVIVMGKSKFNYDVRQMLRSDIVVTVGDWHECEQCNKAVQVARIMEQTVIHETNFRTYVEQNYN